MYIPYCVYPYVYTLCIYVVFVRIPIYIPLCNVCKCCTRAMHVIMRHVTHVNVSFSQTHAHTHAHAYAHMHTHTHTQGCIWTIVTRGWQGRSAEIEPNRHGSGRLVPKSLAFQIKFGFWRRDQRFLG